MANNPLFELICRNPLCSAYAKEQNEDENNIQKFGFTAKGAQRYVCRLCKRTFSEPVIEEKIPVLFERRRTPAQVIYDVLARVTKQGAIVRVSQETGHKEDSILAWAREIAAHRVYPDTVAQINHHMQEVCGLGEDELAAFWAYVDEKDRNRGHRHR